ncbi:hypothetical protein CTEN210_04011 [Chaetoceros tenuissimus]|uniref:Menorin-like domain-containing protein n=1 Tax=Chaetoceros tenuissimus TaxID=426638 RepID=A0AAD3H257_9STRA|nr:hypothetical protein CTEN210_04011 [Chaetoceros tenuissimus]
MSNIEATKEPASASAAIAASPKQTWSHSTCTKEDLLKALHNKEVTAIESDIVMGTVILEDENSNKNSKQEIEAIMAHPPCDQSDLSFQEFAKLSMNEQQKKYGYKHIKLDFKEIKTLDPVFENIDGILSTGKTLFDKTIYLNADILKGPGKRECNLKMEPEIFSEKCIGFISRNEQYRKQCVFSLGWSVDPRSMYGYTSSDVDAMIHILEEKKLFNIGVVLAVNARVLAKDPTVFRDVLLKYKELQLLIWTGTGEPPISQMQIDYIVRYFRAIGCYDQIGLDCQIAATFFEGIFYDYIVKFVAIFWNAKKLLGYG